MVGISETDAWLHDVQFMVGGFYKVFFICNFEGEEFLWVTQVHGQDQDQDSFSSDKLVMRRYKD